MLRLYVQWRLVFVAAVALTTIVSPYVGVQAQDLGAVTTPNPETTAAPNVPDAPASTAPTAAVVPPEATESVTEPVTEAVTVHPTPEAAKAATTPVVTEAVATIKPASTPVAINAFTPVPPIATQVSTDASTTLPPPAAPSVSQVTSGSSAAILSESTSSPSNIRDEGFESNLRGSEAGSSMRGSGGGETASASSLPSSSNSASESTTEILNESFSTTTIVLLMLGGIGLTLIMSFLFVLWRNRRREDPDLETPIPQDTTVTTFPAVSMPSTVAPTSRELSFWKASESSFTSRDLPLTANARTKLNAITRSSTRYDMANRHSPVATLGQAPQSVRGTNTSSEQSFSIREYSEYSIHHAVDSETDTPVMTNERDSESDGYSAGDRYSASGRYSASSRLSSDPGRRSSGWSQLQNLDIHRYLSTSSSVASSVVARNHNSASFMSQDQPLGTDAPVIVDSTTSRTDIPDWYSVIESPTDIGRYTASSIDSDTISNGRESFEL